MSSLVIFEHLQTPFTNIFLLQEYVIENIVTGRCTCTTYNRYLVADEISR